MSQGERTQVASYKSSKIDSLKGSATILLRQGKNCTLEHLFQAQCLLMGIWLSLSL